MADTNNGVQKTVALPNVRTDWHCFFPDEADQPVAFTTAISRWITLGDGLSRQTLNIIATIYGGGASATLAGVVEISSDGSFPAQIGTFSMTAGVGCQAFPFTITSKRFRVRMTGVTPNGALWYRIGGAVTGT